MIIGVLDAQGDVSEHVHSFEKALKELGVEGKVIRVRNRGDMERIDALAIPGGESTTISNLLIKSGVYDAIMKRRIPVMGTCAGCILLAKHTDDERVKTLGLMDMSVIRNAFGRQRESFEAGVDVAGIGKFQGVFIRAPIIKEVWGECRPIVRFEGKIVGAKQGKNLALCFHPELTEDLRIHRYFISTICQSDTP